MLVACGEESPREERVEPISTSTWQAGAGGFWPIGGHAPGGLGGGDWPRLPMYRPTELPRRSIILEGAVGTQTSVPRAEREAEGVWIDGKATHYGEAYNGATLGCGTGTYSSSNVSIVAVSPSRYADWPCGTVFEVCGASGCIHGTRHDACPGCTSNHLDLSEAGITAVCGGLGTCQIHFRVLP